MHLLPYTCPTPCLQPFLPTWSCSVLVILATRNGFVPCSQEVEGTKNGLMPPSFPAVSPQSRYARSRPEAPEGSLLVLSLLDFLRTQEQSASQGLTLEGWSTLSPRGSSCLAPKEPHPSSLYCSPHTYPSLPPSLSQTIPPTSPRCPPSQCPQWSHPSSCVLCDGCLCPSIFLPCSHQGSRCLAVMASQALMHFPPPPLFPQHSPPACPCRLPLRPQHQQQWRSPRPN